MMTGARAILLAAMALLAAATARADILIATASPMTGRLGWIGEQLQRACGGKPVHHAPEQRTGLGQEQVRLPVAHILRDGHGAADHPVSTRPGTPTSRSGAGGYQSASPGRGGPGPTP